MLKVDTRTLILTRSIELFKERGYNDVTIIDICRACNLTKSAFYYHYKSKDELLSDFYSDLNPLSTANIATLLLTDSSWAQLLHLYDILIDHTISSGVAILSQFLMLKINNGENYFTFDQDLTKIFLPLIEKAQTAGEIRNQNNPMDLHENISHTIIGILFDWCKQKGHFDVKAAIFKALEVLFDISPDLRKSIA